MMWQTEAIHAHVALTPVMPLQQPNHIIILPSSCSLGMFKDGSLAQGDLLFKQFASETEKHGKTYGFEVSSAGHGDPYTVHSSCASHPHTYMGGKPQEVQEGSHTTAWQHDP